MKINARLLLINFLVVSILLGGTAVAFYSIVAELLASQESKRLLTSTNDFLNVLEDQFRAMDNFISTQNAEGKEFDVADFSLQADSPIDFVFKIKNDSLIFPANIKANAAIQTLPGNFSLTDFVAVNPYLLIRNVQNDVGGLLYYGINFSGKRLDILSQRIKSEVAVFFNTDIVVFSHESENEKYIGYINSAFKHLYAKNNFDIYLEDSDEIAFYAAIYKMREFTYKETAFNVVLFSTVTEFAMLRSALQKVVSILGVVGLMLGIVLTFFFTSKLRNQIVELYRATAILKSGNYDNRISVVSKDEIGGLATSFNGMMDELQRREELTAHYTEFLTLINNNPTLKELSEAAVKKIILLGNFSIGALGVVIKNSHIEPIFSSGIESVFNRNSNIGEFYQTAITEKRVIEIDFEKNSPEAGIQPFAIPIHHLSIIPVIYNQTVIALLEFGSSGKPTHDINLYIRKIIDQLAIGLANAITLDRLEKIIFQLKELNKNFQAKNLEIVDKNKQLTRLSDELRIQADELAQQKSLAEAAVKAKSRFIATMSHELRTPMNAIIGLTDIMLNDSALRDKNRERIKVVNKSGKRLMALINNVLDISKIEAGKLEIKFENFSLKEFLEEIYSSLNTLAQAKQIDLIFNFDSGIDYLIYSDQLKLGQVLTNIIGNGIKFTAAGFVKLSCVLENSFLKFEIEDTGIGMNENDMRSIFEEFEQAESNIIPKYTGTGLGLSIAKNLTELLGGSIFVKSEKNSGTIFTIVIPVKISSKTILEETVSVIKNNLHGDENENEIDNFPGRDERRLPVILIADDDPLSLFTLCEIVKELDCKIVSAKNGVECLAALTKDEVDIVLLDIMMPELDGFQTIKEIKKNSGWKNIPVFAVTANAMKDEYGTIYKLGFDGIFPKPVDGEELIFKLKNELDKKRIRANV